MYKVLYFMITRYITISYNDYIIKKETSQYFYSINLPPRKYLQQSSQISYSRVSRKGIYLKNFKIKNKTVSFYVKECGFIKTIMFIYFFTKGISVILNIVHPYG